MELNITSSSTPLVHLSKPSEKKTKGKGGWKQRHREHVIQRAKLERRNATKVSREKSIQAEEFESGVECERKATISEIPSENENVNPHKRRKTQANRHTSAIQKTNSNVRDKKEMKKNVDPYQKIVPERDTPSSEAVKATLQMVGDKSINRMSTHTRGGQETVSTDYDSTPEGRLEENTEETNGPSGVADGQTTECCFEDTGLYRSICVHVRERLRFEAPTEIQRKVLKSMLELPEGRMATDLLVRSPTGSGKTLAYLLPIAHYLLNRSKRITRDAGALAIIIVPTRELAEQVTDEARRLFQPWHWIVIGCIVGGENKRHEKARLRKGVNVVVATPGRLLDHMRNSQSFVYRFCEFFVLDEADRLLDLGFESDIKEVVKNLNKAVSAMVDQRENFRSNILLSATLRKDVQRLAEFSLKEPTELSVGTQLGSVENLDGEKFVMPTELQQHFCVVDQRHRLVTLACFLRLRALKGLPVRLASVPETSLPMCKVIVFFSTCDSVDFHYQLMNAAKLPSELQTSSTSDNSLVPLKIFKLHGNHTQPERTAALSNFRSSRRAVLLCTDVAARGLDLKGLSFAIQYDPPTGGEGEELEYLHRAGRTGRMGARGDALLFLLPSERAYVGKLESTGVKISEISSFAALAALYPRINMGDEGGLAYAARFVLSTIHESFESILAEDQALKKAAVAGFQAYCRAYATHAREVKNYFHVRNLHLGHVARAFILSDKPVEFAQMMAELRKAKGDNDDCDDDNNNKDKKQKLSESQSKREIVRAIAEGAKQPFNAQNTSLARRRREKGKGLEAFKEMAFEFGN